MTNRAQFLDRLARSILTFDGAMGTLLMARAELSGSPPERLNLDRPDLVEAAHREYVAAGADIIQTNTFGASAIKLAAFGLQEKMTAICVSGVAAARRAAGADCLVAGSIGPTGMLLAPLGGLSAEAAYRAFRDQAAALANAGVDLFNIETMTDVLEAKLALIAVRDAAPSLPVMVSMTFDRALRTLTGTDPVTAAAILAAAGADVIGTNCGEGPSQSLAAIRAIHAACHLPLLVKPNAGLPTTAGAQANHPLAAAAFAAWTPALVDAGANIVGGCCGTTPDHIAAMAASARQATPAARGPALPGCIAGSGVLMPFGAAYPTRVIGERINPSRRPDLQHALRMRDWGALAGEARRQAACGADSVDINVGYRLPGVTEAELMHGAVQSVQHALPLPVSIDTRDVGAMEAALQVIRGKPLLNSTTADPESLAAVLGLAKRYGAAVIGLPLDRAGVPETATGRMSLVARIVAAAAAAGLAPADLIIDGLTLTAGMHGQPAKETLATLCAVKEGFGVSTVLGVSNVSHGLPAREELNMAFLSMAQQAGLDLALVNALHPGMVTAIRAGDVLTGRDAGARRYIAWSAGAADDPARRRAGEAPKDGPAALTDAVLQGDGPAAGRIAAELAALGHAPLAMINDMVVPALIQIGDAYEAQKAFLPQLLMSAEAANTAFGVLEPLLAIGGGAPRTRGKVLLATVRGDMHDIGKNIVALLLRSHGFGVVDLGRDVAAAEIIAAAKLEQPDVIGLSALMTTTMTEMGRVTEMLAAAGLRIPVLVGGAVLNPDYAAAIGAEYAADAVSGVRRIGELLVAKGLDARRHSVDAERASGC